MTYHNIKIEIENSVAIIRINRPKKMNALNLAVFTELERALITIREDENIRGLFISGMGDKAFIAGADIFEIQNLDLHSGIEFSRLGQKVFNMIEKLGKPVVALVNGFALGGGCELALACHIRIAAENAKFGQPEVNLGLIPGYGGTQRLPRLAGRAKALEMLLTGDIIDAQEALRIGLANRVVDKSDLWKEGWLMMEKILSKGPLAVRAILETVHHGFNTTLEEGLFVESNHFGMCCASEDSKEGTTAFLDKRIAKFKGK
jgi:enoyl-CoA hydratase